MKALNTHPQLQNRPCRFDEAQIKYLVEALAQFFQCYQINDPHERKNALFFDEKFEPMVEAAWVRQGPPAHTSEGNPNPTNMYLRHQYT